MSNVTILLESSELSHCFFPDIIKEMGVPFSHGNCRVAEDLGEGEYVLCPGQEVSCERVPDVVKMEVFNPRSFAG